MISNENIPKDVMEYIKKYWLWNKKNDTDIISWMDPVEGINGIGEFIFSFEQDPKKMKQNCFNMFRDYPYKLTPKQKAIFDKENPFWKDFFKDRQAEYEAMQKKKSKNK